MADGSLATMDAIQRRRRRQSIKEQRKHLEAALDRLLAAAEAVIADLDTLDGDADLEVTCEDEGAQCEDDGFDSDREADYGEMCNWPDEGDQTSLQVIPMRRA